MGGVAHVHPVLREILHALYHETAERLGDYCLTEEEGLAVPKKVKPVIAGLIYDALQVSPESLRRRIHVDLPEHW